ncbi:hypothetical protein GZL_00991 [Streptomyces sp. 769]|nr:hypothetical protein GZL_00991 [Streptomyces sp. 769]
MTSPHRKHHHPNTERSPTQAIATDPDAARPERGPSRPAPMACTSDREVPPCR